MRFTVLNEFLRGSKLNQFTLIDHKNPDIQIYVDLLVWAEYGIDSVRDGDHRAVGETPLYGLLDLMLRLDIDVGRSFIDQNNLALLHDGPGDVDELLLSRRKILTVLRDLWYILKFRTTFVLNPSRLVISSVRQHDSITSCTCSSVNLLRGSTFSRMVPSNNVESCMIIVMDSRSCFRLSDATSTPSIMILPFMASNTLNIVSVSVDFPAPVRPTTPIFSFGWIVNVRPRKAAGRFSRYYTA